MSNKNSNTVVDFIYNEQVALPKKEYQHLVMQNKELLVTPLRVMALLIAIAGLFAMVLEVRYFAEFAFKVYVTRLLATLIAFTVLVLVNTKTGRDRPLFLVHILLIVIIVSSGYMIFLIPQTLVVNAQIVGLMIFTSALFLSWDVKNQIIVAIYYNMVFSSAIIFNEKSIYFLPNMFESVVFVLFLSIISVIGSAVNFRLRMQLAEKSYRVNLSENKYRSIFNNSVEGNFQTSLDGKFLTANPALLKILGYSSKEELDKVNIEFDIYKYAGERENIIKELRKNGKIKNKKIILKRKDGSDVIVRLNDQLFSDDDGEKIYFEGTIQDITEQVLSDEKRKKMEEELRKEKIRSDNLAKQAMQSSMVKSQFLANMSHEIRTPMNGIIGFLSLIERGAYSGIEEMKEFILNAKNSAESLLDLINDILDLSKIESGKMSLEKLDFNIDEVVEESISILSARIKEKELRITVNNSDSNIHYYKGDPKRIRQILLNLLSNAVKFTSKGSITVNISSKEKDVNKYEVYISVEDTGIGIPSDRLNVLFKPFSQVDDSHTRKFGGTGLGLAICKEFVNLMGGNIGVDSRKDEGSKFYFTMILEKGDKLKVVQPDILPEERAALEAAQKSAQLTEKKITKNDRLKYKLLLAEDNFINQKVALKILIEAGYNAEAAMNGVEALNALQKADYDLVLMDVQMPEMDGFTATRQIRSSEFKFKDIPIIAITAHALMGDKEKCLEAGMNDYLSKPINAALLISKLDRWLKVNSTTGTVETKPVQQPVINEVLFDFVHLETMSSGDDEFKKELIETYLDDISDRLEKIESHINSGNIEKIIIEAHTIKGASYSVGAKKVGDEAYGIEISAKQGDLKNAVDRFESLKSAFEKTKKILKDY